MAINTLIQMPYQWLYNPITEISTIGYVIETLGNIIKMLKIPPTITVSVLLYKLAEQSTSGLGRFLECRKCNILVTYQNLPMGFVNLSVTISK